MFPTRVVAKEWGIARNIVVEVYEQLTAEGYLDCRVGSGTYVAEGIIVNASISRASTSMELQEEPLSDNYRQDIIDFATGLPDLKLFPRTIWAKCLRDAAETVIGEESGYGDIYGDRNLRTEISHFLYRAKGIQCSPEEIMIVSGASEGIFLIAMSLSAQFQSVYIENPTIGFTRDIFQKLNYELVPVGVDENGMNFDHLSRFAPGNLVLLTPSHQFPTGSLLSIRRRHKAIGMIEEANSYIIEDDYDSEFRLKGIPVPPLQTLSPSRVIYLGTFSKTLSPSLRIGFLIIPPSLLDTIASMKCKLNVYTPLVIQKALGLFISDGQLDRHIHAMKKVYKKRRQVLKKSLNRAFGKGISFLGDEAGMHLHVYFHTEAYNRLPWHDTNTCGFRVEHANDYKLADHPQHAGIVLGYGNLSIEEIEEGVSRIHQFVSKLHEKTNL
ncbi:GntR family transcriptional regulator [Paenibacillus sp. L3-i20]|nr:GntR family transcriptional regulator [Paenibacillus sp. L3-i20]